MVEKLQTCSPDENNRNNVGALDSTVTKAMSESGVKTHENEKYEEEVGEPEESESATQGESEDDEDERDDDDDEKEASGESDDEEEATVAQQKPTTTTTTSINSPPSNPNNAEQPSSQPPPPLQPDQPSSSSASALPTSGPRGQSAKGGGANRRIVAAGSTSESSIKTSTTPDSSLEAPPSSSGDVRSTSKAGSNSRKERDDKQVTTTTPSDKPAPPAAATTTPAIKLSQSEGTSSSSSTNHHSQTQSSSASSLTPSKKQAIGSPKSSSLGGPLNLRALPFESGINTECIQLLRQLWNVHEEALNFLNSIHSALCSFRRWLRLEDNEFEESLWDKKRLSSTASVQPSHHHRHMSRLKMEGESGPGGGGAAAAAAAAAADHGNDVKWVAIQPFIDGLKCVSDNVSEIEKQCLNLSVFQSQCKLVLYAKIRHAKRQVTHDRLAILHGINQLVTVATQLLASPSFWKSSEKETVSGLASSVIHLSETYNGCLESCWSHVEASLAAANPSLSSTSSDAECSASEMGTTTSPSKIRVLTQVKAANTNDAPLLKQSLKPLSATKLLQVIASRRAAFASSEFTRITLGDFYENQSEPISVAKFSVGLDEETRNLLPYEKAFSKRPSILGRAAVKESENGETRLSKSFKLKMYGYFHEVLWSLVGETAEDLILWSLQTAIPLTLQPSQMQLQLRKVLMLGIHSQAGRSAPLLSTFEMIGGALHSFSLMVNWDEKMREAFEITFRVKRPEHVALLSKPQPSQMATDVGRKFGEILNSCILLMEEGNNVITRLSLPLAVRQKLELTLPAEEPLGDEAQILFRLEATLNYFRAWTFRRAKSWLNSWAVPQFIACSQRDPAILVQMIKSKEVFLVTRDALLKSENIAIKISAGNRQTCAEDMRRAIQNVERMPDELLQAVGIVCRTLSLATLQTYMPEASHWRGVGKGSGLDPDRPSPYVRIFIDRVVDPVFKAAVNLVPPLVQESLGKQVINAMCDAWLHYILQRKIKFSEWGAVQLLRDFVSLREWIRSETQLDKEARKALLHLEILKSCEGVAYLLLRNPGDVLGVGKPSRKSRRVAPASGSIESSPSASEVSTTTAEDDIPPEMYVPDQQIWLQLRLKKTGFSSCCNF